MAAPYEANPLNEIRQTKHRVRRRKPVREDVPLEAARSAPSLAPPVPKGKADRQSVPDEVREKFTQVGERYHFKDGALAFTDRGNKITSPSENSEVIRSMIAIAGARGWTDITVSGTERFRKDAWVSGKIAGLEVRGYKPTEFEQERIARIQSREPSRRAEETRQPPEGASERRASHRERLYSGKLVEHGDAPYRHDEKNATSYFVRLQTPDGERELWGIDLKRALKQSQTQPKVGDEVGVRALRRDAVKVWADARENQGESVSKQPIEAHRNVWVVESKAFFAARTKAARTLLDPTIKSQDGVTRHPELLGTYLQIRAAELASASLSTQEDRARFVSTVRHALADSIARGEPIASVRMKDSGRAPSLRETLEMQEVAR